MAEPTYSPGLRTAVVLCGAGTAGVYQSGVLRALTEAGVKVDLLAAHGAGTMPALCAAIDGGARLWDPAGPWSSPALRQSYRWRAALRAAALGLAAAGVLILSPLLVLAFAAAVYAVGLLASLVNLPNVSMWLVDLYRQSLGVLFHPPILPTILPRGVVLAALVVLGVLLTAALQMSRHDRTQRRWRGAFSWRLIGEPIQGKSRARHSWRPCGPSSAARRRSRSPRPRALAALRRDSRENFGSRASANS